MNLRQGKIWSCLSVADEFGQSRTHLDVSETARELAYVIAREKDSVDGGKCLPMTL